MTYRADALTNLCSKIAALRSYQAMQRGTFGPVYDAWQAKVERARNAVRLAVFNIRCNDIEGYWL